MCVEASLQVSLRLRCVQTSHSAMFLSGPYEAHVTQDFSVSKIHGSDPTVFSLTLEIFEYSVDRGLLFFLNPFQVLNK